MRLDQPCWAIVPAAGVGSRMATVKPKQYLSLLGRPLITYCIDVLLAHPAMSGVVVVLSEDDEDWRHLPYANHPNVLTAVGGVTRAHSVYAGMQALSDRVQDSSWVLVHDAARPGVTSAMLDRLFAAVTGHAVGGLLGVPVVDTVKYVSMQGDVERTISRENVWLAQTPQIFRYQILLNALRQCLQEGEIITDEASAIEFVGLQSKMVLGDRQNLKVTTADDLETLKQYWLEETA